MNLNRSFSELLLSVDHDLGTDPESLNLFEWVIEDYYESQINDNIQFFSDRPDICSIYDEQIMRELEIMEKYFVQIEEYEKCAIILKIRSNLNKTR